MSNPDTLYDNNFKSARPNLISSKYFIVLIMIILGAILGATLAFYSPKTFRSKTTYYAIAHPGKPTALTIPKLSIQTKIEHVGKDKTGAMDVPKNTENAAWYSLGFRPGQKGSAVIAGHFDDKVGPAVFYHLSKLEKGDTVEITSDKQEKLVFRVVAIQTYPEKNFPKNKVFGKTDKQMLNLITCKGKFDKVKQEYSDRIVIYTEKVKTLSH